MRVAVVTESFLPNVNGVTNTVLRALEHFAAAGHEAIVVAPDTPRGPAAPAHYEGIEIIRVPSLMVPGVTSLPVGVPMPTVLSALRGFDPDVVHLASPFVLGAAGLAAAKALEIPAVAVYQTDVAGFAQSYGLGLTARVAWWWTARLHANAERTLAPSTAAMEDLTQRGVPRVHRWARGVDIEQFNPVHRDEGLRAEWLGKHPDRLVVGFVGRLAPEKQVRRLAALADDASVQLVIVGGGPERERLTKMMPSAIFTGELRGAELGRAYASFDVFVHPGEHETFCQAVQEALASGVPSIAPDAGGPRDLVRHCRNGYLLPVDSFEQLLPSTIGALRDGELRAKFGVAARNSVLGRSWSALCGQLVEHYRGVQSGRGLSSGTA